MVESEHESLSHDKYTYVMYYKRIVTAGHDLSIVVFFLSIVFCEDILEKNRKKMRLSTE